MRFLSLLTVLLLSASLAGCAEDSAPNDELVAEPEPESVLSIEEPEVVEKLANDTVEPRHGMAFALEPGSHPDGALAGYDLPFIDEWEPLSEGSPFYEGVVRVVPYGNVTGYSLLLFDASDGSLASAIVSMPHERVATLAVDPVGRPVPGGEPAYARFFGVDPSLQFRAVAAVFGDGGLLVDMEPEYDLGDDGFLTRDRILDDATVVATPDPIGTGSGFSFDAYLHLAVLAAFQEALTYGDVQVTDERVAPVSADPILDATAVAPDNLTGWHHTEAMYLGYESHGFWDGGLSGGHDADYQGIVAQDFQVPGALTAEIIALGLPGYFASGDTDAPVETRFHVQVANVDYIELYTFMDFSLGAPMEALLGDGDAFQAVPYYGLLGEMPPGRDALLERDAHGDLVVGLGAPIVLAGA